MLNTLLICIFVDAAAAMPITQRGTGTRAFLAGGRARARPGRPACTISITARQRLHADADSYGVCQEIFQEKEMASGRGRGVAGTRTCVYGN